MGADGEPPVYLASCYVISIPSEWLSLPPSLKELSPILFNSITLHFLYNTYHHLESSYHLFAWLFIVPLPPTGRSVPWGEGPCWFCPLLYLEGLEHNKSLFNTCRMNNDGRVIAEEVIWLKMPSKECLSFNSIDRNIFAPDLWPNC